LDKESMRLNDSNGQMIARIVIQRIAEAPLVCMPRSRCESLVRIEISEVIREIQNPANEGAFFILPSQFNGVEYPSNTADSVISSIRSYKWENMGDWWSSRALAVHPAVSQFFLDNAACSGYLGGIDAAQDLVRALHAAGHKSFKVDNGYLHVPRLSSADDQRACKALIQENLGLLRTLAALDVPASGLTEDLCTWNSSSHRVNLVYASAVPVGVYDNTCHEYVQEISSLFLRGAYFGALRLALESHSSHTLADNQKISVFLMPIGCGVFNNSHRAVATSLAEAVDLANELCGGELGNKLDLRLLTWEGKPFESEKFKDLLSEAGFLYPVRND